MSKIKLWPYLRAKRSEVQNFRLKDLLLAKTVVDIHRHKRSSELQFLPLEKLRPIHAIDRPNAVKTLRQRVRRLRQARQSCLRRKQLSKSYMLSLMPSVSGIKVIACDQFWVAFEGNGRLLAFRRVFRHTDDIFLQVEVYQVDDPAKLTRRVKRVQRFNKITMKD